MYGNGVIRAKLKGEDKTIELDENEKVKGWDDLISGMKTQAPDQFETKQGGGVDPNPLPEGDHGAAEPQSLAEALRQQYENQ